MIDLYDKRGNVILAYFCKDIENTEDYKIVGGNCYYRGKFIGEIKGEKLYVKDDGTLVADMLFKPVRRVQIINTAITINKNGMEFKEQ
jgi:hypothetical protein